MIKKQSEIKSPCFFSLRLLIFQVIFGCSYENADSFFANLIGIETTKVNGLVDFLHLVFIGEMVTFKGNLNMVGRTSMETGGAGLKRKT